MATTTRLLLRSSKPIQLAPSPPSSSSNSLYMKCVRYQSMASLNENHHNIGSVKGERKPVGAVKATIATTNHITTSKPVIQQGLSDLATLIASIRNAVLVFLRTFVKRKPRNLRPQMLIEKVRLYILV